MTILQDSLLSPFSKVQAVRFGEFRFKVLLQDSPLRFLDDGDRVTFTIYERTEGDTSGTIIGVYHFNDGVFLPSSSQEDDPKAPLGKFIPEKKEWVIKLGSFFEKAEDHEGFTIQCRELRLGRLDSQYPFNYVVPAGFEHSRFKRPETVVSKKPFLDWEIPLWTPNSLGDLVEEEERGAATEGLAAGPIISTTFYRDNAFDSTNDGVALGTFSIVDFLWSVPAKVFYMLGPDNASREQLIIDEGQTLSGRVIYARDGWRSTDDQFDGCGGFIDKIFYDNSVEANFTITTWAGGMVGGQQIVPTKFDRGDDTIWVNIKHDAPLSREVDGCERIDGELSTHTIVTVYADIMVLDDGGAWAISTVLNEGS